PSSGPLDPTRKADPSTSGNEPDSTGRHFPSVQKSQSASRQKPFVGLGRHRGLGSPTSAQTRCRFQSAPCIPPCAPPNGLGRASPFLLRSASPSSPTSPSFVNSRCSPPRCRRLSPENPPLGSA